MTQLEKRTKGLSQDFSRAFSRLTTKVTAKAVHRLRTSIRRIESLVSYTHPEPGRKQGQLLSELADLRKRAGKVRDIDIQLGLLGSIANGSTASDRRILVELFKTKRDKRSRSLTSRLKKLEKSGLFVRLQKITERAGRNNRQAQFAPLQKAQASLSALSAQFPTRQILKPRSLHQLRVKLKQVRYTAELAEESAGQKNFLQDLKSVQDAIGEWHDWESLVKTAERQFGDRTTCPLLVEMRSLFATRYSAANSAVARLFSTGSPVVGKKQPQSISSAQAQVRRA
jgi:CHAD domain-containing protein